MPFTWVGVCRNGGRSYFRVLAMGAVLFVDYIKARRFLETAIWMPGEWSWDELRNIA